MNIRDFLKTHTSRIIISIILGLGISSLFRRVCKGRNCIILKGPSIKETRNSIYGIDGRCYKYIPYMVKCDKNNKNIKTEDSLIEEKKPFTQYTNSLELINNN